MKDISTLIEDIHQLFLSEETKISEEGAHEFGLSLARIVKNRLEAKRGDPYLRFSNIGSQCDRELHYKINQPDLAEKLPPEVHIKFMFGDILEAMLLFLAREAGHSVEGQQDEMSLYGLKGSRDAVIDGHLVDVKSASTFSFQKFQNGLSEKDDSFGYIPQLGAYLEASQNDPLVKNKDTAYFFVIDKTLGHICLSPLKRRDINWKLFIERKRMMLETASLPHRAFMPVPDGKSGNEKLHTKCSYCSFKTDCYPKARVFAYSDGPRFLTTVARLPNVPEMKRKRGR